MKALGFYLMAVVLSRLGLVFVVPATVVVIMASSFEVQAVSGFVINIRNTNVDDSIALYGAIDGDLWRHDIVDDVVSSSKIADGPASRPVISPDGLRAAFIRRTAGVAGKVIIINVDGTGAIELADCLATSLIDFPHADWVYFTMGNCNDGTSGRLKRVNVNTHVNEEVMQIKGHNGVNTRVSQFQISNDLTRAMVRTGDDDESDPAHAIVALSMVDDDRLDQVIGTPSSCGPGLSADGLHVMDGWLRHDGFDIRRYEDAGLVKTFSNAAAFLWPPSLGDGDPVDLKHSAFNSGGATNSDRWFGITTGSGGYQLNMKSMLLINWKDERCIFVTKGLGGNWDHGDFWVGTPGEVTDTTPPVLISANTATNINDRVTVTFDEILDKTSAELMSGYSINGGVTMVNVVAESSGNVVTLTTSFLSPGTYTLTVSGVEDIAGNVIAPGSQVDFTYSASEGNQAPQVNAGADMQTLVGATSTLVGEVEDDGLPLDGTLTTSWSITEGDPASVQIGDADSPLTTIVFSGEGSFTLRLIADDGELQGVDEVNVLVGPAQSITLLRPAGGEEWVVGSAQTIRWKTKSVDDVAIFFSSDDGETWDVLASTIDTTSPDWGSLVWTVPDVVTDRARIMVDSYFQGRVEAPVSEPFSIVTQSSDIVDSGCSCGKQAQAGSSGWLWLIVLGALVFRLSCRSKGKLQGDCHE